MFVKALNGKFQVMYKKFFTQMFFAALCLNLLLSASCQAGDASLAVQGVVERLAPEIVPFVRFESIDKEAGKDIFELETSGKKLIIRGSSGVAMASGFNHYLKYFGNCHVSRCGSQLSLPRPIPIVKSKVRQLTPYRYRYSFNYCTFGYAMAFWDWARWQQEIDWMAMNGLNMPLAATGFECVIREVYRDMGLTDEEIGQFISGPAFLPWFNMGNLDAFGGPLPDAWYEKQQKLQKKILARQRELGMMPVLPAFAGHVPAALKRIHPDATVKRLEPWGGFPGTYVLDPSDKLFHEIGVRYIKKLVEMYGTDHLYSADTFNEMDPPTTELSYLTDISRTVYQSMADADPQAVWVMQGWLFLFSGFWSQPRIDALLSGVPDDKMIILDLFATAKPQWIRTRAFGGKPWIWCMVHNWGGKQGMYGRMHQTGIELPALLTNPEAGRLVGIGSTNEGIEVNPIVFEQFYEMAWHHKPVALDEWVRKYVIRRYGKVHPNAQKAWKILLDELYTCNDKRHGPQGSFFVMRPTLNPRGGSFVRAHIFYDTEKIQDAFILLLAAADELKGQDTYHFDLVDLGRQVMSDLSQKLQADVSNAYNAKDKAKFAKASQRYLDAIQDTDKLLSTNRMFLVGRWLQYARDKATTQKELILYEWNARNLITLWGSRNSPLHDYAQRQYGGLMGDFNYNRWRMFFDMLSQSLKENSPFNPKAYEVKVRAYEESWTRSRNNYPVEPSGDPIAMARIIANKYCSASLPRRSFSEAGSPIHAFTPYCLVR